MHLYAVLGEGFSGGEILLCCPPWGTILLQLLVLSCGGAGREALLWAQWLGWENGGCPGLWVIPGPPPG